MSQYRSKYICHNCRLRRRIPILQELNFHGDKGVWIGFTDQDKEDDWRWSSGILNYT